MRKKIWVIALALFAFGAAGSALAQGWPRQPPPGISIRHQGNVVIITNSSNAPRTLDLLIEFHDGRSTSRLVTVQPTGNHPMRMTITMPPPPRAPGQPPPPAGSRPSERITSVSVTGWS